MKIFTKILLISLIETSLLSHDLWVDATNKKVIEANIIYGHNFPKPETISEERVSIFEPVKVIGRNGTIQLKQSNYNYNYIGDKKLEKGTYIINANYKPTAWSETADGKWYMNKTRKDIQEKVKSCGIYSMSAKHILIVENDDGEFATKPLNKGFEITPLVKASQIKQGMPIKFKVTKNGKKIKFQDIYGSIEGYSDNDMSMAFYGKTDLKGEFIFTPLKSGLWYLKANHKSKTNIKDCEISGDKTTISFQVLE